MASWINMNVTAERDTTYIDFFFPTGYRIKSHPFENREGGVGMVTFTGRLVVYLYTRVVF